MVVILTLRRWRQEDWNSPLQREFEVNQRYMKPCHKNEKNKNPKRLKIYVLLNLFPYRTEASTTQAKNLYLLARLLFVKVIFNILIIIKLPEHRLPCLLLLSYTYLTSWQF